MMPRTVLEVLDLVLRGRKGGHGDVGWDEATPGRLAHLAELLRAATETGDAAVAEAVVEAEQRLAASGWLQIPAREVTAEQVQGLLRRAPWAAAGQDAQLSLPRVSHG